jgi:hypothetical protein
LKECALPFSVTALACAVAENIPDTTKLEVLALALTQLADTLALIAQTRISPERGSGD